VAPSNRVMHPSLSVAPPGVGRNPRVYDASTPPSRQIAVKNLPFNCSKDSLLDLIVSPSWDLRRTPPAPARPLPPARSRPLPLAPRQIIGDVVQSVCGAGTPLSILLRENANGQFNGTAFMEFQSAEVCSVALPQPLGGR
jgi:hypothetical protein